MTMAGRTVELTVAGETCRVVTTADESELRRLASMVEDRLVGVWQPGRPVTTKAMLLAAVALAHELDEQRTRADAIAGKAREAITGLLRRVDGAIEHSDAIAREREGRRRRKLGPPSERSSGGVDGARRPDGDWDRDDHTD
jgi:cell division protein ZapA